MGVRAVRERLEGEDLRVWEGSGKMGGERRG